MFKVVGIMYKFTELNEGRLVTFTKGKLDLGVASGITLESTVFDNPVAIISIRSNQDGEKPELSNTNARDILYMVFHDIDVASMDKRAKLSLNEEYEIREAYHLISHLEAMQIIEFVEKNKDIPIICQCEAGISRSAGVAAALSVIYNDTDNWVFNNKQFIPNRYVRWVVINAHIRKEGEER